ncbi:MAG: MarR family transcriptional regulator [Chlorobium sp.]
MGAKDIILDALKKEGEPLNAGRITELTGLDRKEVDKAMKALKDEELIVSPRRCYWEPTKPQ